MTGDTRPGGALSRMARLLIGRNALRRPCDRAEGVIVMLLAVLFLAALAAAPSFGEHLYQSQRAGAAHLHQVTAVLTQNGPSDSYVALDGVATARWRAPDGHERTGILSTNTVPAISGATAGTRVPVWLTSSGQPTAPPVSAVDSLFASVVIAACAVCGAAIALLVCYGLCRVVLDRRRLAAWTSEWSLIGPLWTSRR